MFLTQFATVRCFWLPGIATFPDFLPNLLPFYASGFWELRLCWARLGKIKTVSSFFTQSYQFHTWFHMETWLPPWIYFSNPPNNSPRQHLSSFQTILHLQNSHLQLFPDTRPFLSTHIKKNLASARFFFSSGREIWTLDTTGMNRVL